MRIIKSLIIFVLLIVPGFIIRADRIECGTYVKNGKLDTNDRVTVYIENNRVKSQYWSVLESSSECPDKIYKWYCSFPDGAISYQLEQSDNTWPCKDWGFFLRIKPEEPSVEIAPSDKYEDIELCRTEDPNYIRECACMPAALADLTSGLFNLLKIIAPTLLLIVGGFELIKAMTAQDEKAIKKAQDKLIKKFIAAAAIFLVVTAIQFLVSALVDDPNDVKTTLKCINYLLNGYNV